MQAEKRMRTLHRLAGIAGLVAVLLQRYASGDENRGAAPRVEEGTTWYDVSTWGVEGKAWSDTKRYFDRLPGKAEGVARGPVWSLSRHSAGMAARFKTDASRISVRYVLLSESVAMPHMPATGVSGVDLYAKNERGQWRWLGITRPDSKNVRADLASDITAVKREYMAYLPLYNGVESLEIGVPEQAAFEPLPPRSDKPIVFYGTSILHGGCASRPGMAFPAILGRRLDRPTINLGFSGNGKMDPEVGGWMAEIDAAAYVIDCLPNMTGPEVAERAEPLVRQLRAEHPQTPIVLVEDRTYSNAEFKPSSQERHSTSRAALKAAYERLVSGGVTGLSYLEGEHLLGDDGEATVDSSHPSDLGMMRMADALEPVLRKALGK